MKSYIITLKNNELSIDAALRCKQSSNLVVQQFQAVTPRDVPAMMMDEKLIWTYPWDEQKHDFASGLVLSPYRTQQKAARIACFLSHYQLWKESLKTDEPILILEHDAIFIHDLDPQPILDSKYDIVGINDPRGATRKSGEYHRIIQQNPKEIQPVPRIDDMLVPQGLAGNSAYIIKPNGAKRLIELVKEFGAWPNDAIMCYQLVKNLGVTKTYYTKVQGTRSTTSS
jgi:GR25 family glycosyltransferase involved in LPS biosynthesis